MNYSENANTTRVDIFNASGKWVETVAIENADFGGCIHVSVQNALNKRIGNAYKGHTAVCIEPFHKYSHPISFVI